MKHRLQIEKTNFPNGGTCYSMYGLEITLYDKYLVWDRKLGRLPETMKIAYSSIDGVSCIPYAGGAKIEIIINGKGHGWIPSFNRGLSSYDVAYADLKEVADAIDNKRFG